VDELLTRRRTAEAYLARAEAAVRSGRPAYAWVALDQLSELGSARARPQHHARGLAIARTLPETVGSGEIVGRLWQRAGQAAAR
jgi:hypothetical protein